MQLCIACSSTLPDPGLPVPSSSEKASVSISFDCGHVVCPTCARRKSLQTACILCQSAHDLLSSGSSSRTSSRRARDRAQPPRYTPLEPTEKDGFVLGDDSDDDSRPPPAASPPRQESSLADDARDAPPAYDEGQFEARPERDEKRSDPTSTREQCDLHYLKPEETLLGLAFKYNVDGPLLCTMNRLPLSTLSTTPHLVHTLPFVVLPPGARPSTSTRPLVAPEVERRRLIVRRFQVATRCSDYGVATAYVDQVFERRTRDAAFVRANRDARGDADASEIATLEKGGELEEACAAYLADERWENEQKDKAKGKGKGLFGAVTTGRGKTGSTWSWR